MTTTQFKFWEVRYTDLDPDTGYSVNDQVVAVAFTEEMADLIKRLVEKEYQDAESNPNREFYVKPTKLLF